MGGYYSKYTLFSNFLTPNEVEVKELISQSENDHALNLWTYQTPEKFMDYVDFNSSNPIDWGDKLSIIIDKEDVELKIGDNHLVINKLIASGGEGEIYIGCYNNREVIVKVSGGNNVYFKPNDELQRLKYLNIFHPEIAPLVYTYFKDLQGQEVIVMEKLEKFVYSIRNANILRSYIRRMQESKLYHGDITPGNIMQNSDGVPKLIDFGTYNYGTPFYSQIKGIDEKYKDWQSLDRSLIQYKHEVAIHTVAKMDLQLLLDNQSFLELISISDEISMLRFLSEQNVRHIQLNLIHWKTIYSMNQKYFLAIDFLKQKNKEFSDLSLDSPEIVDLSKYMESIHISDEQFLDMVKATV